MASLAKNIMSSCPNTKIALSGYSQGATVVHAALSQLDGSKISAVVVFGDPENGVPFRGVSPSRVKEFCGSSDFICAHGASTTSAGSHLSYGGNTHQAAKFIESATGGGP